MYSPWVVGSSPLAIMPSHSWIIFGIVITGLLWNFSYDNITRKLKMLGTSVSDFLENKTRITQSHTYYTAYLHEPTGEYFS